MTKYILTISLLLFNFSVFSQLFEYFDNIRDEFTEDKQIELTVIESNILQADKFENEAKNVINMGDTTKSISYFKKAADIYKINYRSLFLLVESKLNQKIQSIEGKDRDYVQKLLDDAKNSLRISIARRHLAYKEKDNLLAYEFYKSAHLKEVEAVDIQAHAYGILIEDIVEDMTIEKIDYSAAHIFDNAITDDFDSRSFTVFDPSVQQNLSYYKVKDDSSVYNDVYADNTNNLNIKNSTRRKYYRIQKEENGRVYYGYLLVNSDLKEDNYVSKGRKYRIQIGTSILPANKKQIDRLNNTDLQVHTYKSDVYYKYTVGDFTSFKEAKNYKHAFGLKNTYIVEYQDGREKRLYLRDFQ